MQGCYNNSIDRLPPPYRVAIDQMTADLVELYRSVPPPGQPIPVGMHTFPIKDYIPEDKEIAWAVHRLNLNHSGGPSGMRAEHLCH